MEKSFKIPWFQSPPTSCWWPQQRCTACYPWENPLYISMVISHSVLFIRLPFRVNLWTWKNQVKWSAIPGFIGESGTSWQSHSKICPLIYIIIHPMSRLEHIWLRYNCYSLTSLNSSYHVASTKSPSPTSWVLSCLSQHHPTSWKVRNKTAPWPRPSRICLWIIFPKIIRFFQDCRMCGTLQNHGIYHKSTCNRTVFGNIYPWKISHVVG